MELFQYFIYAYLAIGFLYAMYILLFAGDPWYSFPINMVLGPAYIVMYSIKAFTYKGRPTFQEIFKNKKVVVFDMDGTLVDTHKYWYNAFVQVGMEKEINLTDNIERGAGLEDKWHKIFEYNDMEFDEEITAEYVNRTKEVFLDLLPNEVDPIEGFWSLARELKEEKGARLVLASNTDRDVVDEVVKRLNMQNVFDFTIGGNEVKNKKPSPDIYKRVSKEMGEKSKHILVFEDSPAGSEAAVRANMDTIVIWDTEKVREFYPDKVKLYVPDFTPFPGNLDKTYRDLLEEAAEIVQEYNIDFS